MSFLSLNRLNRSVVTCAIALGLGAAALVAPATASATTSAHFKDVSPTSQFGKAIYALADDGVVSGFPDGTFRPGLAVTRQAFVHFVAGVLNSTHKYGVPTGACVGTKTISPFSDVTAGNPFCQEITNLAQDGLINGYSGGTFHPGDNISRQAEAALLYRLDEFVKNPGTKPSGDATCSGSTSFKDVSSKNAFCGDIEWASKNGITKGYSDGGFHPAQNSSRQASVYFLYQLEVLDKLSAS